MQRRAFVRQSLAAGATALAAATLGPAAAPPPETRTLDLKGRVNHSVCKWCYPGMTVEQLAATAKEIGMHSVELLGPEDWPTLARYDLICAMAYPRGEGRDRIRMGFNRTEHHTWLVPQYLEGIKEAARAGYPNLICFSGNRDGLGDEEGLERCAEGLRQIMPEAERQGVTICMEGLNSKVDHADYQFDHMAWGVELVDRVGSDRFKLLYDIYHMQIMEGDVIRTIRDYHPYIAHYHTGGNPGRHEIDDTQELNYGAIVRAIVETGFKGFVAQEFIPTRDPVASLREGVTICDV